jgi:hypothetical protein
MQVEKNFVDSHGQSEVAFAFCHLLGTVRLMPRLKNKHLRYAVHLFSEPTITRCAWAEIYYKAHRAKDHSHARALRCLGQRWLKIIHKMYGSNTVQRRVTPP